MPLPDSVAKLIDNYGKNMIQQQIEQADAQIDKLVYALYGLTDAEIAVVEGTR